MHLDACQSQNQRALTVTMHVPDQNGELARPNYLSPVRRSTCGPRAEGFDSLTAADG